MLGKYELSPTTYRAGGTEAQKGQGVCQRSPSWLLVGFSPCSSAMHTPLNALSKFILRLLKKMANQGVLLLVEGLGAGDGWRVGLGAVFSMSPQGTDALGSGWGRQDSRSLGGVTGHSVSTQSTGGNSPLGAYCAERAHSLENAALMKATKRYLREENESLCPCK